MTGDPKHAACWEKNPRVLSEQLITGNKKGRPGKGFKGVFLKVCQKRDNIISDTVMVHLQETPSDIHAADTRY